MQTPPRAKYITNKELLLEIHRSKTTFCSHLEPRYADYDAIVPEGEVLTLEFAQEALERKNAKPRRGAAPEPPLTISDLVFRVMTHSHIPLCDDKKKRSRSVAGQGHLRTNFAPFKHFVYHDGKFIEVGRSHWKNGLHNGEFCLDHGKVTNRLAMMFMLLVDNYARRGNWRSYTYNDEMKSSALLQLSANGLLFDESKSENPFAFYTTTMKHAFTRVLNVERKNQDIRDDMLIMAGAMPSFTRQIENEMAQKAQEGSSTVVVLPAKRGRKPKSATPPPDNAEH